ncbi:MAG: hypothetical protein IKX14_00335, partial [Neisseriaceae bacterium]|nr:hypothetical protein [Neisseriaceae bacterium]
LKQYSAVILCSAVMVGCVVPPYNQAYGLAVGWKPTLQQNLRFCGGLANPPYGVFVSFQAA